MHSPVAPWVEMVRISIEGIQVDQCPESGGHWLDQGELSKLLHQDDVVEARLEAVASDPRSGKTSRLCPRDNTPLEEKVFRGVVELRVDVCPTCGGLWLDSAELSQALTLLGRSAQPGAETISPHNVPTRSVLRLLAGLFRREG